MCGIAGIFDMRGERPVDRGTLQRMTDALHHRGPDGSGFHVAPVSASAIAGSRSSICRRSGEQPLFNEDGTVCVIFNGEIYNFQRAGRRADVARATPSARAATPKSSSTPGRNGARIAFERFQRDVRLRGLGRAAAHAVSGARPARREAALLHGAGRRAAALRLRAEGAARRIPSCGASSIRTRSRIISPMATSPIREPIYRDVAKLPPAHSLTLQSRRAAAGAAAILGRALSRTAAAADEDEAARSWSSALREAVAMRMIADVPLGAFLSGGVDSSAVVAMMAGVVARAGQHLLDRLRRAGYDESAYAEQVAERYHTDHLAPRRRRRRLRPARPAGVVSTTSRLPTARRSRPSGLRAGARARHRRAVGRRRRRDLRRLSPLSLARLRGARARAGSAAHARGRSSDVSAALYPKAGLGAAAACARRRRCKSWRAMSVEAYFLNVSIRARADAPPAVHAGVHARAAGLRRDRGARARTCAQARNRGSAVAGAIRRSQDLSARRHPDQGRSREHGALARGARSAARPHLVEWLAALPSSLKLHGREGQVHLQEGARAAICRTRSSIARSRASRCRSTNWFRGPLRDRIRQVVAKGDLVDTGMFDVAYLRSLVDQHQSGTSDHSSALWSLMMFDSIPAQRSRPRPPGSRVRRASAEAGERRQLTRTASAAAFRGRSKFS